MVPSVSDSCHTDKYLRNLQHSAGFSRVRLGARYPCVGFARPLAEKAVLPAPRRPLVGSLALIVSQILTLKMGTFQGAGQGAAGGTLDDERVGIHEICPRAPAKVGGCRGGFTFASCLKGTASGNRSPQHRRTRIGRNVPPFVT